MQFQFIWTARGWELEDDNLKVGNTYSERKQVFIEVFDEDVIVVKSLVFNIYLQN